VFFFPFLSIITKICKFHQNSSKIGFKGAKFHLK
jgi:hypothetical protein